MGDSTLVSSTKYIKIYAPDCSRARKRDGYARRSHVVAEKALGKPLLKETIIHHHDEDTHNDSNDNLVICEDENYHRLLHKRMRIVKLGGDPNTDKICGRCNLAKPFKEFYRSRSMNSSDRRQNRCISCMLEVAKIKK